MALSKSIGVGKVCYFALNFIGKVYFSVGYFVGKVYLCTTKTSGKNLLKLYMNDVGVLTSIYYRNNPMPVLKDVPSINLGSVYETVVAQELRAHGFSLFYYDNKKNGEVDFLIDDEEHLSVLPIEVKSGKDYTIHSSLSHFLNVEEYHIHRAYVFSNEHMSIPRLVLLICLFTI